MTTIILRCWVRQLCERNKCTTFGRAGQQISRPKTSCRIHRSQSRYRASICHGTQIQPQWSACCRRRKSQECSGCSISYRTGWKIFLTEQAENVSYRTGWKIFLTEQAEKNFLQNRLKNISYRTGWAIFCWIISYRTEWEVFVTEQEYFYEGPTTNYL